MNIAIYARCNTHNQTENAIKGQLAKCYEYAQKNSLNVIRVYIDNGFSENNENRPQLQQMLKDCSEKQFEGILVYQLDRFARNRYDLSMYKYQLKQNAVKLISATENLSNNASSILFESILEGMIEHLKKQNRVKA